MADVRPSIPAVTGTEWRPGLAQAVSEMLWLWAALFDGPPPNEAWTAIQRAVRPFLDPLWAEVLPAPASALTAEALAAEYEEHFLVPSPHGDLSLYDIDENDAAGSPDWWFLAAALELPWRKERFTPGRAYPVRPDHLSVLFAMWAILVAGEPAAEVAGRLVAHWVKDVGAACQRILRRLGAHLPQDSGYRVLAAQALAYSQHVLTYYPFKEGTS